MGVMIMLQVTVISCVENLRLLPLTLQETGPTVLRPIREDGGVFIRELIKRIKGLADRRAHAFKCCFVCSVV